MAEAWAKQALDEFFSARSTPTREQCDQSALTLTNASAVRCVQIPGSLSYTVICTVGLNEQQKDLVVSFREADSGINSEINELAREIHGSLVPETEYHGMMSDAEPPLSIYSMTYLPGITCMEARCYSLQLNPEEEVRHTCYIRDLAKYFARCWSHPQQISAETQAASLHRTRQRLINLRESQSLEIPQETLLALEDSLPSLFDPEYPQVLTHGALLATNILVDKQTCAITGIVDWSFASVLPFGMELDSLFLFTGFANPDGWHEYDCHSQLKTVFWEEFWEVSGVEESSKGEQIRTLAEKAAMIGALLRYSFEYNSDGSPCEEVKPTERYAFEYNSDGSPCEEVNPTEQISECLKAWFENLRI